MNREQWLNELMHKLISLLEEARPGCCEHSSTWRVSCGFPGGGSPRKRIGECWGETASSGKLTEIFISPTLESILSAQCRAKRSEAELAHDTL